LPSGAEIAKTLERVREGPVSRRLAGEVSTEPIQSHNHSLEVPVEDLLRRARPLPPHEEMVIDDLTEEEGIAFLAALEG